METRITKNEIEAARRSNAYSNEFAEQEQRDLLWAFIDVAFPCGAPYIICRSVEDARTAQAAVHNLQGNWFKENEYIVQNPIAEGMTRKNDNVQSFRNWVIEFDGQTPEAEGIDAWVAYQQASLAPIMPLVSALVYSGNKSIHAWVCCAEDVGAAQWKQIGQSLLHLVPNADKQLLSVPSQLVRLPGALRGNGYWQRILFLADKANDLSAIDSFLAGSSSATPLVSRSDTAPVAIESPATQPAEVIPAPAAAPAADGWLKAAQAKIEKGEGRNETGLWLCCQLRDNGIDEIQAAEVMAGYVSACPKLEGKADYTTTEALATLRGVYAREAREPATPSTSAVVLPATGSTAITTKVFAANTDLGNAKRFVRWFGGMVCHAQGWGWMIWDGKRWGNDIEAVKLLAQHGVDNVMPSEVWAMPHTTAEEQQARNAALKWAFATQAQGRIGSMMALAECRLSVSTSKFDRSPDLLNCQNGIINLRTGELLPHSKDQYLTKLCPVNYQPVSSATPLVSRSEAAPSDTPPSLWERVVGRAMSDNPEMTKYLQTIFGYAATGRTDSHDLYYLYGAGANGKSTIVETVMDVLGDYSLKAKTETILASGHESGSSASPDIAALQGRRLVVLSEIEAGKTMAEAKIKNLTGGDTITARRLFRDLITFQPTHKLMIFGNHKLNIRGTDEGMWRRIKFIEFGASIPEAERIRDLHDQLRKPENMEGILGWIVQGAMRWYAQDFATPKKVTQATQAYREEFDILKEFIELETVTSPTAKVKASALYAAYKNYMEGNGENYLNATRFGLALAERGFSKNKTNKGIIYEGIGLAADKIEKPIKEAC